MADKSMLAALNEQLSVKSAEAERIAAAFPHEDGKFAISSEMYRDFQKAVGEADEIKSAIATLERHDAHQAYLNGDATKPVGATDNGNRFAGDEVKTLADAFIESKAFGSAKQAGFESFGKIRAEIEGKSIYNFSGGTVEHQALGNVDNRGIYERAMRKMHIRDLFPKSTTKSPVLYGVRETGWVNNAAQVNQRYAADGTSPATGADTDVWGRAPKSKITLEPVMFPVGAIKHSLDAHKYILDDEGRLRTFLNTRMLDGVKYAEDVDLLHSTGSAEKITGLFNTPGIQQYNPTGTTDKHSVQVRRAITKALLAEYDPSGLIISPNLWESIEVEEDNTGAFRVAVAVAVGAEKRVWRLNVVETTAMSDLNYVVGAFGMGAQLHDRLAVSVSVSSENAQNFEDGIVTFLAEERVAFEVSRPESFVVGTWV